MMSARTLVRKLIARKLIIRTLTRTRTSTRTFQCRVGCIGLGLLLIGCASPGPASLNDDSGSLMMKANATLVQKLPITAQAKIAGKTIQLEVATTPQQKAIGLMNRTSLADDQGMLFQFDPLAPRRAQFWMKNTLIPLDMLFLRQGVIKAIAANVPPCQADPCPAYGSQTELIDQVIELRGGRAAQLGVKVGDRVTIQYLKN